jgi:hypothetical protein
LQLAAEIGINMINTIKGYDKIKELLNNELFIDFNFVKEIYIKYLNSENIIQRDVKILLLGDLLSNKGIIINFYNVSKFVIPDEMPLQISGFNIENIKNWGWENTCYRASTSSNQLDSIRSPKKIQSRYNLMLLETMDRIG